MKTVLFSVLMFSCGFSFAQSGIEEYELNKKSELFYSGGIKIFSAEYKTGNITAHCLNTENNTASFIEFEKIKARFSSTFTVNSANNFYLICQSAPSNKTIGYADLTIAYWNGSDALKSFEFKDQLYGGIIRYVLANDEYVYFLLDMGKIAFQETDIYKTPHQLMRFHVPTGTFTRITYGLPLVMDTPFTSFWFPLRIENGFTEWYRTKVEGKIFKYEVVRLDSTGNDIETKVIESEISTGTPEITTQLAVTKPCIYYPYDVFAVQDSLTKNMSYSLLNYSPLNYVDELDLYFSTSPVTHLGAKTTKGIYLLTLNGDLTKKKSFENPDIIKGSSLLSDLPKYGGTHYKVAFTPDSMVVFNVLYKSFNDKLVAGKSYTLKDGKMTPESAEYPLVQLSGLLYPGVANDMIYRKQKKIDDPEIQQKTGMVYTGKSVLYLDASSKSARCFLIRE